MATAADLERLAMALDGTTCSSHFDRTAFKVARMYMTLPKDGLTANLKLTRGEQELKCVTAPEAFQQVPTAWGEQGWTTVTLAAVSLDELDAALRLAWTHALPKQRAVSARKSKR